MKRVILSFLVPCIMLFTATVFAQQAGGWGGGTRYGRMYDPKTVETISGVVEKVEKITPMRGMSYGIHLLLKTDKENVDVHLGPGWYMDKQNVKINKGDTVEIKGSKVTFRGKPVVIAAEVKKGSEVLRLRNENGVPAWAGGRRR